MKGLLICASGQMTCEPACEFTKVDKALFKKMRRIIAGKMIKRAGRFPDHVLSWRLSSNSYCPSVAGLAMCFDFDCAGANG